MTQLTNEQIADRLDIIAAHMPADCRRDAPKFEVTIGSLTFRCAPTRAAVQAIANKYRKPLRLTGIPNTSPPSGRRTYSADVVKRFAADGEIRNAVEYMLLCGREPIIVAPRVGKCAELLVDTAPVKGRPDFVVGRFYVDGVLQPWNVMHVPSGQSCSSPATDKAGSLLAFEAHNREMVERAVKSAPTDYQTTALAEILAT